MSKFNPEILSKVLSALQKEEGIAFYARLKIYELDPERVEKMIHLETEPTLDELLKLAEYTRLPIDFLVGRCSKEVAEMALRHILWAFETGLCDRRDADDMIAGVGNSTPVWPENLMVAVNGGLLDQLPVDWEDTIRGVMTALEAIPQNEREMLLKYYRDDQTYKVIGMAYGVSTSRVNQLVARALQRLREPNKYRYVMFGYEYASEYEQNSQELADLRSLSVLVKNVRENLDWQRKDLDRQRKDLDRQRGGLNGNTDIQSSHKPTLTIEDLDKLSDEELEQMFPARLNESDLPDKLRRKLIWWTTINTIGELIAIMRRGGLSRIRKIGAKTVHAAVEFIYAKTGIRFDVQKV